MRGERQIIDMRREGYRPKSIFVQAGFEPVVTCKFDDPDRAFESKQYPEVWISQDELGGWLDMRFAAGSRVHVHGGFWSEDLLRFLDKLVEVGPSQIIVCTDEHNDMMVFENEEWVAYANS